jgi:hypothetical protein
MHSSTNQFTHQHPQHPNTAAHYQVPPSTSSVFTNSHSGAALTAAALLKVNSSYDSKKLSSLYSAYDTRPAGGNLVGRHNSQYQAHSPYYNSIFLQKLDHELNKLELASKLKPVKHGNSLQQEHFPTIIKQNVNENFNVTNNWLNSSNSSFGNNAPAATSNRKELQPSPPNAPVESAAVGKALPKVENRFRGVSNARTSLNEQAVKNAKTAAFIVDLNRNNKQFGSILSGTMNAERFVLCFFFLSDRYLLYYFGCVASIFRGSRSNRQRNDTVAEIYTLYTVYTIHNNTHCILVYLCNCVVSL